MMEFPVWFDDAFEFSVDFVSFCFRCEFISLLCCRLLYLFIKRLCVWVCVSFYYLLCFCVEFTHFIFFLFHFIKLLNLFITKKKEKKSDFSTVCFYLHDCSVYVSESVDDTIRWFWMTMLFLLFFRALSLYITVCVCLFVVCLLLPLRRKQATKQNCFDSLNVLRGIKRIWDMNKFA